WSRDLMSEGVGGVWCVDVAGAREALARRSRNPSRSCLPARSLARAVAVGGASDAAHARARPERRVGRGGLAEARGSRAHGRAQEDRKSVVWGKRVKDTKRS